MEQPIRIALVRDHNATVTAHAAIPKALEIAASVMDYSVQGDWIATRSLSDDAPSQLHIFDGVWCIPNSPYESMEGALEAIRFARSTELPFFGTCAGYQHAVLEYT